MANKFIPQKNNMHKSVYIQNLDSETRAALSKLSLDSVFVSYKQLNKEAITKINSETNAQVYAKITCFEGQDLLDKFPDSKPVECTGKDTSKDWYVGVCPTHDGVRAELKNRIDSMLSLAVNGIWLQFMQYPTKWDEPQPYIMDTCYCPRCLQKFENYIGEKLVYSDLEELYLLIDGSYYQEWLDFKAENITSMVKYARSKITASGKDVKLGYFAIPWDSIEHGAAIQRIVAQERTKLTPLVDVTSPMLYHKLCNEPVEWVNEKVEFFWNIGAPFLPLIQVAGTSTILSDEEFKTSLEYAAASPSIGVCVFSLDELINQNSKFQIVQSFFVN